MLRCDGIVFGYFVRHQLCSTPCVVPRRPGAHQMTHRSTALLTHRAPPLGTRRALSAKPRSSSRRRWLPQRGAHHLSFLSPHWPGAQPGSLTPVHPAPAARAIPSLHDSQIGVCEPVCAALLESVEPFLNLFMRSWRQMSDTVDGRLANLLLFGSVNGPVLNEFITLRLQLEIAWAVHQEPPQVDWAQQSIQFAADPWTPFVRHNPTAFHRQRPESGFDDI